MADRLFVIDGMAYAFRAYFAIRNLRDSSGQPVNAVFGFARILLKILRDHEPSHVVIVFDAPGKTFRDEMYPEYKAHRDETPADLIAQFPMIDTLIEAFNIPIVRVPGVEADDVLATLARQGEEAGLETVLVSGDKDILQAVTEKATVFDPHKGDEGIWYGPAEVKERYGVPPEHVTDVLGLMGDSSDNIPGVRGIGEKTARKLLEKYQTIDGVYEHIDELKGKQKERLIEDKEMAYLSLDLVTLKDDVDFEHSLEDFRHGELDREKLAHAFADFEFRSLTEEFLPESDEAADLAYESIVTLKRLNEVLKQMRASGIMAVDTETTSVQPMLAELVGVSMSCKENTGYYIPLAHLGDSIEDFFAEKPQMIPMEAALDALRPVLEDPKIRKIGHNIKYDYIVLFQAGIRLQGIAMDTMLASYLTDPSRLRHNLAEVSLKHLRRRMLPISDLIGKGSKAITFDKVPVEAACGYACEDADVTWRLSEIFQTSLKERELESLFNEVEIPLIEVLARMEMAGVALDTEVFEGLKSEIEQRLDTLEHEIFELAGEPFQINSPKQLQKILFDDLGLTPTKKTKTGYSTDVGVLEELAREHPLPEKILEYRTLEKLRGTYVNALPKLINPKTGRIHTSFNQAVAATGRLSSSDPNLQNIPVRTELGRRIRQGFIAGGEDLRLISADYSQIELRILAHMSGDENLRRAFHEDLDIHRDTAARVFGVLPEEVTTDMRRQAKAVNFGVVYGISAFGLARNIGVSNSEAAAFIENYFAQYPGVKEWIERTKAEAKQRGYVTTLLNRRRYVPELTASDAPTRRAAERVAINTPVQGTAADVIKVAMIRLDAALADSEARLLLQVHDELLVEAPLGECEEIASVMKDIMESAIELDVPLKVDVCIGLNWAEIH